MAKKKNKKHGVMKYTKTDLRRVKEAPTALLEKIKENPKDLKRFKYHLEIIRGDDEYNDLDLFEQMRLAAMAMQIDKFEAWEMSANIEEIERAKATAERIRKMNEFLLNFRRRTKKEARSGDSMKNIKELFAKLSNEKGELDIKWKRKDDDVIDVDYEIINNEEDAN